MAGGASSMPKVPCKLYRGQLHCNSMLCNTVIHCQCSSQLCASESMGFTCQEFRHLMWAAPRMTNLLHGISAVSSGFADLGPTPGDRVGSCTPFFK